MKIKPGVLVISHGSRKPLWVSRVEAAVRELAGMLDMPVEASYLELVDNRLIQDGIDTLEGQGVTDILVIPLFVSSGSTHVDEIAYALGAVPAPEAESDLQPFEVKARVHFGKPVDDDRAIAVMVWDKVRDLSKDPEREVVLLIGHGSRHEPFRIRWEQGITSLARLVGEVGGTRADAALLNPGNVREKVLEWKGRGYEVIAAPLFLSEGYFTEKIIPDQLEGLGCHYSGQTLLPHPLLAQWMAGQVRELVESLIS